MIKSKIKIARTSNHSFHATIVLPQDVPSEFLKNREITEVSAIISKKECIIEIHDAQNLKYNELQLWEFIIKISLGISIKNLRAILIQKYGSSIVNKEITLVLYKFIEEI